MATIVLAYKYGSFAADSTLTIGTDISASDAAALVGNGEARWGTAGPLSSSGDVLPLWTANTVYPAQTEIVDPTGTTILVRKTTGTSRSTYDTTEQALWSAAGASIAPVGGQNALTGMFHVMGYGAKADAVTLSDGAMSSTVNTTRLSSASASFTSADVGKVAVVCNAKGAGVHLYTTIASVIDPQTVALGAAATATVSGMFFTYGTDDTTAWQAATTAAQAVGGTVLCPSTPSLVTAAVAVTAAVTFQTQGATVYSGALTTGELTPADFPVDAPIMSGSVLVQAGKDQHGISAMLTGRSVNVKGTLGIYFAGLFNNTGHGIVTDAPALSTYKQLGLTNARIEGLMVFGHDGAHYALSATNTLLVDIYSMRSWGGGGFEHIQNNAICNMGNIVVHHLYVCRLTGSGVHGIHWNGGNLGVFIRPQVIDATGGAGTNTHFVGYGLTSLSGYAIYDEGSAYMTVISPDFEGTVNKTRFAPGRAWDFIGDSLRAEPDGLLDTEPYQRKYGNRRLNRNGSVSLDSPESTGGVLALLNDIGQAAKWGITTDGTVRMQVPGTFQLSGKGTTAVVGAALGTGPPPVVPSGTDMSGRAIFGSGTSPATGQVGTLTFSRAYANAPNVFLTANNAATQALGLYVSASTTTTFTVSCAVAPSASQSVSTYDFSFLVLDDGSAPAAPVVYDSFDRTDNASVVGSPAIGPAPTVVSGTWGISSNKLYCSATGGRITWDAGKANFTFQFTFSTASSTQDSGMFRYVDVNNYWSIGIDGVWKQVAGVWTHVQTFSASSGDVLKVVTSGSSITPYKNGAALTLITDSALSSATKVGFGETGGASASRFDLMSVT